MNISEDVVLAALDFREALQARDVEAQLKALATIRQDTNLDGAALQEYALQLAAEVMSRS